VAIGGGLLICVVRRPLYLGITGAGAIFVLSGTCLFLLQSGNWLPLVPATIALIATGGMTTLGHRRMDREI
jgi:adenylate cyclase